ncbi:pabB [Symbiodinium sp. KB8]|nr:pabB [Symbiodinium sp. KB8]
MIALPAAREAPRSLGQALREAVAAEARKLEPHSLLHPSQVVGGQEEDSPVRGSALAGLLGYDLVQWTQPLALEHPPDAGELLGVLYRVDRWLIHHRSTGRLRLLAPEGSLLAPGPQHKATLAQEAIRQGLLYQLNFGRTWQGTLRESPWQLMQKLFRQNAAPYSGFLQLEVGDRLEALCSCSPEQLLELRSGHLSTCPIKGTIGRDSDAARDDALRKEMVASQKEVAEHLMLVDLERHDLGYACSPCSVAWERWRVETFPNVQHMVSKVSGKLLPDRDVWSALEALFPGGSITGCPKTPCIAAIDALEGSPRRSWTGSLGFADLWTGDGQWNILIRTVEAAKEGDSPWRATIKAGGGLTIGSDPEGEVEEAKLKAKRLLDVAFGLGNRISAHARQASGASRSEAVAHRCIDPFNPRIAALLGAFREGRLRRGQGRLCGRWFLWQPGEVLPPLGPTSGTPEIG